MKYEVIRNPYPMTPDVEGSRTPYELRRDLYNSILDTVEDLRIGLRLDTADLAMVLLDIAFDKLDNLREHKHKEGYSREWELYNSKQKEG